MISAPPPKIHNSERQNRYLLGSVLRNLDEWKHLRGKSILKTKYDFYFIDIENIVKLNYTHFLHSCDYGSVCLNIFECVDMYVGVKCVCMHMRTRDHITLIHKQFLTFFFFLIGLTSLQTKKTGVLLLSPPKHWNCRQKLTSWAVCLGADVLTWALMLWIFNYLNKSYELDSFICNTFQLMKFIPILTSTQ